jgi:hypothetical protein
MLDLLSCLPCLQTINNKKSRKELREEFEKNKQALKDAILSNEDAKKAKKEAKEAEAPSSSSKKKKLTPEEQAAKEKAEKEAKATELLEEAKKNAAATKIQSRIRGFVGRIKAKKKWNDTLDEANSYWSYIKSLLDEADRIKRLREAARKAVSIVSLFIIFCPRILFNRIFQSTNSSCCNMRRMFLTHLFSISHKHPRHLQLFSGMELFCFPTSCTVDLSLPVLPFTEFIEAIVCGKTYQSVA